MSKDLIASVPALLTNGVCQIHLAQLLHLSCSQLGFNPIALQCQHIVGWCEELMEEATGIDRVAVWEGMPSCLPLVAPYKPPGKTTTQDPLSKTPR